MNYQVMAETMKEDFNDWILSHHGGELRWIYEVYINEYLDDRIGELNDKAHREMSKHLLNLLIK